MTICRHSLISLKTIPFKKKILMDSKFIAYDIYEKFYFVAKIVCFFPESKKQMNKRFPDYNRAHKKAVCSIKWESHLNQLSMWPAWPPCRQLWHQVNQLLNWASLFSLVKSTFSSDFPVPAKQNKYSPRSQYKQSITRENWICCCTSKCNCT